MKKVLLIIGIVLVVLIAAGIVVWFAVLPNMSVPDADENIVGTWSKSEDVHGYVFGTVFDLKDGGTGTITLIYPKEDGTKGSVNTTFGMTWKHIDRTKDGTGVTFDKYLLQSEDKSLVKIALISSGMLNNSKEMRLYDGVKQKADGSYSYDYGSAEIFKKQ